MRNSKRYNHRKTIPNKDRIEIIHQILLGIEQCHKKIVHGDLKPRKYIIKISICPNEMHKNRIKISDFGLSLIIKDDNEKIHGGREGYLALEVWKGRGGYFHLIFIQ